MFRLIGPSTSMRTMSKKKAGRVSMIGSRINSTISKEVKVAMKMMRMMVISETTDQTIWKMRKNYQGNKMVSNTNPMCMVKAVTTSTTSSLRKWNDLRASL